MDLRITTFELREQPIQILGSDPWDSLDRAANGIYFVPLQISTRPCEKSQSRLVTQG